MENPAHNLPVARKVEDIEVRDFDVVRPRKPDNTQDILERIEVFAALPPTLFRQGKIRYHRIRKRIEKYPQGQQLRVADSRAPEKYFPNAALVEECQDYAKESGGSITLTEDVKAGTKDADVIYTDVWVSMGEPDEVWEERIRELTPYKVTKEVMENAGEKAIFLHCLPAFHDWETKIGKEMGERFNLKEMEVTDEVFESEQSVVFDEAENRMHTIKAVMAATLGA